MKLRRARSRSLILLVAALGLRLCGCDGDRKALERRIRLLERQQDSLQQERAQLYEGPYMNNGYYSKGEVYILNGRTLYLYNCIP